MLGFIIRGFIWDIPIIFVAYVLFWGPNITQVHWTAGDCVSGWIRGLADDAWFAVGSMANAGYDSYNDDQYGTDNNSHYHYDFYTF